MVAHRGTFLAAIGLSVALLILGKMDDQFGEDTQRLTAEIFSPLAKALSQPLEWSQAFTESFGDLMMSADEVTALRLENEQLRMLQPLGQQLASENAKLRMQLALPAISQSPKVMARSITHPGGAFLWTVLLDAGRSRGVANYQPVIDHIGVVGRILTVGQNSSRALLVTDMNSRVPVMIEETGDRAILEGDNSRTPILSFLEAAHQVAIGNRVVTSGDGGIFPPLLPVGIVTSTAGGELRVTPHADLSRLEFVQILAYKPLVPPEQTQPEVAAKTTSDGDSPVVAQPDEEVAE